MTEISSQMRRLALRLMACETSAATKSSETAVHADIAVIEKLRAPLTNLVGTGGFRGLLSRALALGNEEVRWLRAVHVKADGRLEGLAELRAQIDGAEFTKGKVVLLAELLGLLVAFIGVGLTTRLLLEIWPKLSLGDLNLENGDGHEKKR